jgi:two-component system response regulator GlrR
MQSLLSQAKLVAASDASVLVQGESGTGKELLAQAIHLASPRYERPFVAINCAALPEALLESELFGHSKGAFTGALRDHQGLIKNAHGGTLFLDEIGDMPLAIQAKLLRALQERVIRPVGSTNDIAIDVRVICATHKNLVEEMLANRFREDLYYRINVVSLEIPPLTARREDIPLLANYFLEKLSKKHFRKVNGFAPEAMEIMLAAPWPGNVRQLQNIVEQVVVLSTTPIITSKLVQNALQDNIASIMSFDVARKNFEQQYLINLLKATQGNVTQSARIAGRNRTEFYKILQRHHINPSLFKGTHNTE